MKDPTTPARPSLHPAINTLLASLRTGDPKIHNGLGLWPVFADCRPEPAYLTLVEALSLDGFKITEVSEGGSVPSLRVINETSQHVLLFDGEELKGAKQNRILNTSILIAAGTSLDVPVSCTEQGRWSYASAEFGSSGSVAYAELRKRKSADVAFSLQANSSHASNQSAVWDEIESLHIAAKTSGSSKTTVCASSTAMVRRCASMTPSFTSRSSAVADLAKANLPPNRGSAAVTAAGSERGNNLAGGRGSPPLMTLFRPSCHPAFSHNT